MALSGHAGASPGAHQTRYTQYSWTPHLHPTRRHPSALVAIRSIDLVELAQQRRPFEHAEGPARGRQIEPVGLVHNVVGRQLQLHVARERRDLDLAGALELEDVVERLRDAAAYDEQAEVA